MADILITNIDFPKGKEALALEVNRHGEVFVFYRDETSGRVAPLKRRESNAIELPPHGTLKEIPFILDCFEAIRKDYPEEYNLIRLAIERTPFVVEATREGKGIPTTS